MPIQARLILLPLIALLSTPAFAAPAVSFAVREGALDIRIDDQRVAEYVWQDPELPRPYFRQLTTPDGIQVSRSYPPDPVADKDNDDHAHYHPGAWLAFGDAAGADFWRNKARVRHLRFLEPPASAKDAGSFAVVNAYESSEANPQTLFTEICTYTITPVDHGYIIAAESEFKATSGAFAFGDQEEMGFGVRLATPLTVRHGDGSIVNSAGGKQEAGTWGKQADWCAGYGTIDGQTAGMSVMASPENFRSSWYHSRDYGLIVANPFGKKAMTGPKDPAVAPDTTPVAAGEPFQVGFGVYVFSLPEEAAPDLEAMYKEYTAARD